MNPFLRFLILIFLTAGLLFGGYAAGWYAKFNLYDPWIEKRQIKKAQEGWQKLAEEIYKDDIYGSQNSPEETFQMFLDALKKEDLWLASRYFVVGEQDEWFVVLKKKKEQNKLAGLINLIENMKSSGEGEKFYYYSLDKDGVIEFTVNFNKNPITKIWKISSF